MSHSHNTLQFPDPQKRKKKAGSLRWVLLLVLLLLAVTGGYYFSTTAFFAVDRFEVNGNTEVSRERIIELCGIAQGENIFAASLRRAEYSLTVEPRIKSATVRRFLPSTIKITVSERQPAAYFSTGSGFVCLDSQGVVLQRYSTLAALDFTLLLASEAVAEGIVPGSKIEGPSLQDGLSVLAALPAEAISEIYEVNAANAEKIVIFTKDRIEIRLGDAEGVTGKYKVAAEIIANLKEADKLAGLDYIDVSLPEKAVYYYKSAN